MLAFSRRRRRSRECTFWDKENSPDWRFLRAKRVLGRASEKKRRDGEFYYSKTGGSERKLSASLREIASRLRTLGSNPHFLQARSIKKYPLRDIFQYFLAEARGFEPPVRLPAHTLSKRAP